MAYTVNKFDGTLIATVEDGTIDNTTNLRFIGKNYAGYGEIQNENFLHMLENFAGGSAPSRPVAGQMWYDSASAKLKFYDGSKFTADMAIQNVIGDSFRGATWVSIHNGGGVGWGEVINGGFGMLIDGSEKSEINIESMLFWDVNNGIARRNWARNKGAINQISRAMQKNPKLKVTLPNLVDDNLLKNI